MQSNITKACADFLRESFNADDLKIKSSHAHEIAAAFFGYSSKAALLAEKKFPIEKLVDAKLLIPDVELMAARIQVMQGISAHLETATILATQLIHFLQDEDYFTGDAWLDESFEDCVREEFSIGHHDEIEAQLLSLIASTNTPFAIEPIYEGFTHKFSGNQLMVTLAGELPSNPVPGKKFIAEILSFFVDIEFPRVAGKVAFLHPQVSVRKDRIFRDPESVASHAARSK